MLRIVPISNNDRYTHLIDGKIEGKRKRIFFASEREAKAELKRLQMQVAVEGEKGLSLPAADRILAAQAVELLRPYDKTVLDAARFYVKALEAAADDVAIAGLFAEYVESKRRAKHQAVSIEDIQGRLGRFNAVFGHRLAKSVKPGEIEDWLYELGFEPLTINNYRAILHAFFAYLLKRKRIDSNPVAAIDKIKCPVKAPEIFEPEGLRQMLEAAPAKLLPALLIGAFAGLRASEVLRLDWKDVDLVRCFVHVASHKTKTARRRLVKIQPNLAAWLAPYAGRTGKVWVDAKRNYHYAIEDLTKAVAEKAVKGALKQKKTTESVVVQKWPQNGLRHSFASYHLAKFQNANQLALELGHTTTRLIFEHYRELVPPEAAEQYFTIYPAAPPANVLTMPGSSAA
jgi:integrase